MLQIWRIAFVTEKSSPTFGSHKERFCQLGKFFGGEDGYSFFDFHPVYTLICGKISLGSFLMKFLVRLLITFIYPLARLYWLLLKPKTKGVRVIIIKDQATLLVRNSYEPRIWNFPGGGVKRGESPQEAAVREVGEEVGIQLEKLKERGTFLTTLEGKRDTVWVFCTKVRDPKFKIDGIEIVEAKWINQQELPSKKLALADIAKKSLNVAKCF